MRKAVTLAAQTSNPIYANLLPSYLWGRTAENRKKALTVLGKILEAGILLYLILCSRPYLCLHFCELMPSLGKNDASF